MYMAITNNRDPQYLPVKLSFTVPFWYSEQLRAAAEKDGLSLNVLITNAVERRCIPQPPPRVKP
jgi:hypothetical protein